MTARHIQLLWRLLIGGVFLLAAAAKLVRGYQPDGPPTIYSAFVQHVPVSHYLLIGLEAFLGVWLLSGLWPRAAAVVALVVLLVFCGVLVRELFAKDPRLCGCSVEIWPGHDPASIRRDLARGLTRNVILILGASYLALGRSFRFWRRRGI